MDAVAALKSSRRCVACQPERDVGIGGAAKLERVPSI